MLKNILLSLVVLCLSSTESIAAKEIKIASGSILEGYYTIALRLCADITAANEGLKCSVVSTSGTAENMELLEEGKVDFAVGLSTIILDSYNGTGHFSKKNQKMVQLLKLHDEIFTIIVKDDDKILSIKDLDGKKLSNGPVKSDSEAIYKLVMSHYKFNKEPIDVELSHEEYASQFCKDNIDAIIMMTGHPNALANHVLHSCQADFVSIGADVVAEIVKKNPELHKVTLPAGIYEGIDRNYDSLAASAIFVARKSVDKEIITNFMTYFNSRIDEFRASYPTLNNLSDQHFTTGFVLPGFKAD